MDNKVVPQDDDQLIDKLEVVAGSRYRYQLSPRDASLINPQLTGKVTIWKLSGSLT